LLSRPARRFQLPDPDTIMPNSAGIEHKYLIGASREYIIVPEYRFIPVQDLRNRPQ
jgi:hypothetical protein